MDSVYMGANMFSAQETIVIFFLFFWSVNGEGINVQYI